MPPPAAPDRLLIFLRQPILGLVKTRLATTVGAPAALAVYRALLAHTRAAVAGLVIATTVEPWLYYADGVPTEPDGWPATTARAAQASGDLGARMAAAFTEAFAGGSRRAIVIGTDCPELTSDHLRAAFAHLADHDVALGPAADGGYYLLGLTRPQPELFAGIAWSTERVQAQTLAAASKLGLRVALLPTLSDVDTANDLARFPHLLPGSPSSGPPQPPA